MSKGFGFGRTNRRTPPAAAGTITALQNGLIDIGGGVGEIGGSLLHATAIDMAGFAFSLTNGIDDQFTIDPAAGDYRIGDLTQAVNGTQMRINDPSGIVLFSANNADMISLDGLNFQYLLGDIGGFQNGLVLSLDDTPSVAAIGNTSGGMLSFNQLAGLYQIGDLTNSTNIELDTNSLTFDLFVFGNRFMEIGPSTSLIGDIDSSGNGAFIEVDILNDIFRIDNVASNMGVEINGVAGFSGTVTPVTSITINNGIVTNAA